MRISRGLIVALLTAAFVAGCSRKAIRPLPPVSSAQTENRFETDIPHPMSGSYLLYLPERYDRSTEQWPLVFFLHGEGQRGSSLELVRGYGLARTVDSRRDFPCIVVSPQCPAGSRWSAEYLSELLDDIMEYYRVDTGRIYLTGTGMGAQAAWELASRYPGRFAAMAPVSGGGNPALAGRIRRLPVRMYRGDGDSAAVTAAMQRMADALKRSGNPVTQVRYSGSAEDSWSAVYGNPDFTRWLLAQRLGTTPAPPKRSTGTSRDF